MNKKLIFLVLTVLISLANNQTLSDKIKTVVLLELENRSFDHLLGWMSEGGPNGDTRVNGLKPTDCNPLNISDPS